MSANPRPNSWLLTLSLTAIAVVYVTFVWVPGHRATKDMAQQLESMQTFVAQSTGLSAGLMGVQQELDKADSAVRQWEKAAPQKRDIPALYGKIDSLAKDAHLSIGRFDPQPFVVHEKIRQIPVAMSCSGTFGQIYQFLQSIERLPPTIWLESMRIEKKGEKGQDVQCELDLAVFSDNSQVSDYAKRSD